MPEMKDSGIEWIGEVPNYWQFVKAKYVFLQRNEKGNNKNLQLLSPTQKFGVIPQTLYEELTTNSAVKLKESTDLSQLKTIHEGDFCISLRSFQGGFEYSLYEGVVSPAYQVFFPSCEVYSGYYRHLFKDQSFISKINSYTLSLRDGKNIAFSDFGDTLIPFPPLEQQKKIANYLDVKCNEIDSLVSDILAEIEILEEYKNSMVTEAVTRGVNIKIPMIKTGYTFIPYVPEHWEFTKAGRLFVEDVRSAVGNEQPLSLSQKDGLIKTEDMVEHAMKSKTYAGWKKVRKGDLVLNRFKAHLGVFFSSKYDGMVSFHYGVYVPKVDLNIKFYEYLFHAKPYCDMYAELSNGITVGLQNLSNANFYAGKCVYPPKEEQDEIVKFLDDKCGRINETISLKREQLLTLEELKKSVIYEYVTGKKEVPLS